jgi:hypothetical protein
MRTTKERLDQSVDSGRLFVRAKAYWLPQEATSLAQGMVQP